MPSLQLKYQEEQHLYQIGEVIQITVRRISVLVYIEIQIDSYYVYDKRECNERCVQSQSSCNLIPRY